MATIDKIINREKISSYSPSFGAAFYSRYGGAKIAKVAKMEFSPQVGMLTKFGDRRRYRYKTSGQPTEGSPPLFY